MRTYRVSMPTWGISVLTLRAGSEEEARGRGEQIFRQAFSEQRTFPQFLSTDDEIEHNIDTEFEIEVDDLSDEDDPRVEPMARAFAQDVYGLDHLDSDPQVAAAARRVARRMLDAIEEPAPPIDRDLVDVGDLRKGDVFSLVEETGEDESLTVTETPTYNLDKHRFEVWVDTGDMGPGTTMIEFFHDDAVKVIERAEEATNE